MKIAMAITALALAALLPRSAQAQCNGGCTMLVKSTGELAGYGCVTVENSGKSCIATTTRCTLSICANALLTTPEGRVIGEIPCADEAIDTERLAQVAEDKQQRLRAVLADPIRIAHARPSPSPAGD
jgi:hypothetical protein